MGTEKRRARRTAHHYIIRFKRVKPEPLVDSWDVSTVKDISKTGIAFYTSRLYEPDAELEILMKNPLLQEESRCWATVVRSTQSSTKKNLYEIAVDIKRVEEPRDAFDKTIEFFIKKEEKDREKKK